jgi:hypothetical protein
MITGRPWAFWPRQAVIGCLLAAGLAPGARGGELGALRGEVRDPDGTPIAGVAVVVSCPPGPRRQEALTGEKGEFRFVGVTAGSECVVQAFLTGYAPLEVQGVRVERDRATLVHLTLEKAAPEMRESVHVRASSETVRLEDVGGGSRFDSEWLDALPILGRNYEDVLVLAPGVTDVNGDGAPNIHGARDTDVVTLVDGISMTDPLTGKGGIELNLETVQEIEVKTTAAAADYGRAQGGFVDIQTKSGGNRFEATFKLYYRTSRLDGDGAGFDDPRLHGGVPTGQPASLSFHDAMPFLSLSGPIVKDHAWFYVALESIHQETPVNALRQQFVTGLQERRNFGKVTWQVTPNARVNFTVHDSPVESLNQGLNSFTDPETGFTVRSGGLLLTGRHTVVLSPTVALETTLGYLDTRPGLDPNLGPDTNGNGTLFFDRNLNGFQELSERDPGEDYDRNGAFDVYEDLNHNGKLNPGEDRDGDHLLTMVGACEGVNREDIDCDGRLDVVDEDTNHNGLLDKGEDSDGDGRLDRGIEDRNHNGIMDDTPFPATDYPYGHLKPYQPDRDQRINLRTGIVNGPYYLAYDDHRERAMLRQDMTTMEPSFLGSHDLHFGYSVEREHFARVTTAQDLTAERVFPLVCKLGICLPAAVDTGPVAGTTNYPTSNTISAILPSQAKTDNDASSFSSGLYVSDTWKPVPQVALTLGLRFDRESASSVGWTPFDPAAEAKGVGRIQSLIGGEQYLQDWQADNNGLVSMGVLGDPLFDSFQDRREGAAFIINPLRLAAARRFTRSHDEVQFAPVQLQNLIPGITTTPTGNNTALLRSLGIPVQTEQPFNTTNNNLSPRLAVSWDPAADGRTKLFATWGRFYDRLFLNTIIGEAGPDWVQRYYFYDSDGLDGLDRTSVEPTRGLPDHYVGKPISFSAPSITQIDRSLQTPYSDELTLGFEREVAPEVALSIRYVRRDYREQLQDVDINHHTLPAPGGSGLWDQIGLLLPDPTGNEPARRVPDGKPDLYIDNPFFNQVLLIGNTNTARYRALELQVTKRMSRRFALDGSYVYSRAEGAAEDFQSRLGNDPSTVESEYGYLDYDQRHVVKLNSVVYLPGDWQFGMGANWSSGLPYSVVARFFSFDSADYQQYRTRYGYVNGSGQFVSEGRNSRRNNAVLNIDMRVKKSFVLGHTVGGFFFDVFNVLNSDDLRITAYDPSRAQTTQSSTLDPTSSSGGSATVPATSGLQIDGERRFGRRYQIGFQFDF